MENEINAASMRALLPERPEEGHKGTFGHLFVIAASRGFCGAAKLTCEAAGRSGVGLVTAGVPYPLGDIISVSLTEAMSVRLPATEEESLAHEALEPALAFARNKQAVVLGPGLSRHEDTTAFVLDFIPQCAPPLLIDADALNALSENTNVLLDARSQCVVTPHPGEMARLTGQSTSQVQEDRKGTAHRFATEHRCVTVLKGHRTVVVSAAGEIAVNTTGNNGLGTGGSGDVLSGLIGGLLAQGMKPFDAARLGVYLHGRAGDIAANQLTPRALIASDIIQALPKAWKELDA